MDKRSNFPPYHLSDDFNGKIFMPLHVNNNHFVLVVADMEEGELMLIDSLNDENIILAKEIAKNFVKFSRECTSARGNRSLSKIKWKPVLCEKYNMQTGDFVNCALMTIRYMECIAKNEPLYEEGFDKWKFRNYVAHELLRCCTSMENICLRCTSTQWKTYGAFQGYQCNGCKRWIHFKCLDAKYENVDLSIPDMEFHCLFCRGNNKYLTKWIFYL